MASQGKASLVFIPLPVISHLAAAVKTAELLAHRDSRLSITVLVMNMSTDSKISSYINNPPHPRINFVQIEQDQSSNGELKKSPQALMDFVANHKVPARNAVSEMMSCSGSEKRIVGFVVDILCAPMVDLAKELHISSYIFYPSGAAILGLMFHLQSLHDGGDQDLAEYKDSDAVVSIPTYVNPVPARVWPDPIFDRAAIDLARKLREVDGIVVNTFSELESYATNSLSADNHIPRVYTVGPIIGDQREESEESRQKCLEIVKWLDGQPDSSVVYLCFGSMGAFGAKQVAEIAAALERSGVGFLWSLRKPVSGEGMEFPRDYENVEEGLPEGFIERTTGVGKVIGWAPQMAILSHPSVGGFVSHCGWNSTLESIWCGVPMATWPVLANDQQTNAFLLVKDIGISVEIKMDYKINRNEIVSEDRIAKAIEQLMDPKNEIRVRIKELKEKSRRALMEGGSSYKALGHLIDSFMNNC